MIPDKIITRLKQERMGGAAPIIKINNTRQILNFKVNNIRQNFEDK